MEQKYQGIRITGIHPSYERAFASITWSDGAKPHKIIQQPRPIPNELWKPLWDYLNETSLEGG